MEKIIETKQCKHCGTSFDITDRDMEFYDKISPVFGGEKCQLPPPTFCPDCRHQRRLAVRIERTLYKRTCDWTGKQVLSIYSPDKPYKVYEYKIRRSDKWNPLDYGREFDFSKTFTEQYNELLLAVPKMSLSTMNNENCDFVNQIWYCKDCYLCFDNGFNENCMYAGQSYHSKYVVDSFRIEKGENLYECHNVKESYKLFYSQNCTNCNTSYFLKNCINCTSCLGCMNLISKDYHIFNQAYSKEEYKKKLAEYQLHTYQGMLAFQKEFDAFVLRYPNKYIITSNSENCDGDYLSHCKNCHHSFSVNNSQDCTYVYDIDDDCQTCMDVSNGAEGRLMYESTSISGHKVLFNRMVGRAENIFYCDACLNGKDCFGCVSLHGNEQYCILNKQYTKAEYEELVPKIIEHMTKYGERGEFFDPKISAVGYNETLAQEQFPLTKEEALTQGFLRSDYEAPAPQIENPIQAKDLPEDIHMVADDILHQTIICEASGKPFRIIKQELDFYRKHELPIPKRHPDQRHIDRMALRNPRKLFERKCAKCGIEMKSTYSAERPEMVYCESCYNKEIYG